ncbi:MAG TPA: hypothetical protein VGX23_00620 [Actinocrinis sp.]|nr:hypothetical protein [Actinocrinis sp.]
MHLTDGRTVRRAVPASHGTPDDPMTDAEIHAKYTANATRAPPADQARHLAELVDGLDRAGEIGTLLRTTAVDPEHLSATPRLS